jgi:hypothetical protein
MSVDLSKYTGINDPRIGSTYKASIEHWGVRYKKQACGDWSAGGFEVNLNDPASLKEWFQYLLKCFLAGKKCCKKPPYGSSLYGFQYHLRVLKSKREIASSCFASIAYMQIGLFTDSIRVRRPSEKLAAFTGGNVGSGKSYGETTDTAVHTDASQGGTQPAVQQVKHVLDRPALETAPLPTLSTTSLLACAQAAGANLTPQQEAEVSQCYMTASSSRQRRRH